MMEDWTDIIGEQLESIEEPLPADDWSVLQQKYAASRRRKKAAAFAWAGGITSVAAAIALILLLTRPDTSSVIPGSTAVIPDPIGDLIADQTTPTPETTVPGPSSVTPDPTAVTPDPTAVTPDPTAVTPGSTAVIPGSTAVIPDPIGDLLTAPSTQPPVGTLIAEATFSETTEETFDVIRDTLTLRDRLLADASPAGNVETNPEEQTAPSETYRFEDFPEDEPVRKKRLISIGLSRATSDSPIIGMYDMFEPANPDQSDELYKPEDESDPPIDTTGNVQPQQSKAMMRGGTAYTDSYDHDAPVSFGLSARFKLTDRISLNTGVNYTRYTSTRNRRFIGTYDRQTDRQNVHYFGIPVRFDWTAVSRKNLNFYIGAGMQVDKCIYATVGNERLREKQFLLGLNGTMGLQVNIVPRVGLYFEPEMSYALNEGTIKTFRSDEPFVITVRGGLRFNF